MVLWRCRQGLADVGREQSQDHIFMDFACRLARRGRGRVFPNPSVGCVLVRQNGEIVTLARTADGGRPHAEFQVVAQAPDISGCTAYVTLEPCAHEGSTPSCARLLAEAGIARVVVGCLDPDPRTAGQGVSILQNAGVTVDVIDSPQARKTNAGFLYRIQNNRPFITLKLAMSADGYMRTADQDPPAITGAEVQKYVHMMRAENDAILTGIGTVLSDDPKLTARLAGLRSPLPYVADRSGRFPTACELDRPETTILTTSRDLKLARASVKELEDMEIGTILSQIASDGVNWLMVEAGPNLSRSILQSGYVDRLVVFTAPQIIDLGGAPDRDSLGLSEIGSGMRHIYSAPCGVDRMDVWERGEV